MTTTNVISTPAITGNIGSCNTNSTDVVQTSGIFKDTGYHAVTNSCTGTEVDVPYTSLNGGFYGVIVASLIVAIFILAAWANSGSSDY